MTAPPVVPAPARALRRKAGTPRPEVGKGDLGIALLFIAPAALGLVTFYLWPTVRGLYLSFTEFSLFGSPELIGFDNYVAIAQDALFWNSMKVTLWYVVLNIGFQTVIALGLAVLMHRLTKSGIIRGSILLPYLIAPVIAALLWFWMLDYQIGIVNSFLEWSGIGRIAFFGNESWAIPTIAFVNVWKHMGYTALLIFAGLQTIPTSVYEAAAVDGSTEWKTFWRITLPLLRPVLVLVLIITVTGSFQVFDTVAVTTGGGPGNASRVIQVYIVERAFERSDFGYAAALSAVLFVILAVVAWAQNKFLGGNESDLA
ncbi:carbohydrate ABC transporter permease [Oryzobacter sp. R7]|uniref:carbohydrate ABC transporter permease n=1 Tax=Oryzobacter faecalis TaxID=3388656 RepID=UPI00398D5AD1